jgi:large subunit ribosomal protein L25
MAEMLHVQIRDTRGKRNARRDRLAGQLPAVLYGHGKETLSLLLSADEFQAAMRHGARLVNLTGAAEEQAFIRQLQWNTWGTSVLHVDFTRISEHEKLRVRVVVELRGEAPGLKAGGIVKQQVHELQIECEATALPERLYVNVNQLELNGAITIAQLEPPPGVVVLGDVETIVVECVEPMEMIEAEAAAPGEAEPEVIGRKKEEEGEEESE